MNIDYYCFNEQEKHKQDEIPQIFERRNWNFDVFVCIWFLFVSPKSDSNMSFEESVIQSGERGWWPIASGRLKRIEEVKLLIGQKGQNVLSAEKNFYKSFFSEWSKDHYKLEETDIGDGSTMMDLSQMSDEFMTPEMR